MNEQKDPFRDEVGKLADQLERIVAGDRRGEIEAALDEPSLRQLTAAVNVLLNDARHTVDGLEDSNRNLDSLVRQRTVELDHARNEALGASKAKSEFLARISHELRTPLNAIIGFAQLLLDNQCEPLSERQRRQAMHVLRGGRHLLDLINDVLDLSRIETGHLRVALENVDPRVLILDSLQMVDPLIEEHGLRFENRIDADAALPSVRCDYLRTKQCLINLLSNAFKYNVADGLVWVDVAVRGNGLLRFLIGDTGIGIPESKQHELFLPFSRLGQEQSEIEGSGVGLSLTRSLIYEMEGALDFESTEGIGTTFWFDLPVSKATAANGREHAASETALFAERAQGTVLYIEDNPSNVSLMENILDDFTDMAFRAAATAEAGVQIAIREVPDVIILDINLSGMSGIDAARYFREVPETTDVVQFALSADAREETQARCEQAGIDRFFAKPVDVYELVSALNDVTK